MERLLWQGLFALILVALFYRDHVVRLVRAGMRNQSHSALGYLFATCYALMAWLVIDITFARAPIPRFEDLFLAGIALTAYLFSTRPAAFLLAIGLGVSVWVLHPAGIFNMDNPVDWYRVFSFGAVSLLLLFVMARLKLVLKQEPAFRLGYVFATAYAVIATVVALIAFRAQPLPRFNDIFLVGIAITAYFYTVMPAAYLLAISVAVSAWILPPSGSFAIASPADWYRCLSFTAVAGLLILLTGRLKKWSVQRPSVLHHN